MHALYVCRVWMPSMHALYVCLTCMPYMLCLTCYALMHALYVYRICMPSSKAHIYGIHIRHTYTAYDKAYVCLIVYRMYALHACRIRMPSMYALLYIVYVCLTCMPYTYAFDASFDVCLIVRRTCDTSRMCVLYICLRCKRIAPTDTHAHRETHRHTPGGCQRPLQPRHRTWFFECSGWPAHQGVHIKQTCKTHIQGKAYT